MTFYRSHTFPSLTGAAVAVQDGVGALHDDDAIVTTLATVTSVAALSGGDLDGVIGEADCTPLRGLTVTTSAAVGAYTTGEDIVAVVEEVDSSGNVTEKTLTAALTDADGGETIDFGNASGADASFTRVISITIPAMADTDGALTFGVGDIYARQNEKFKWLMGLGTGNVKVEYPGGIVDVLITADGRSHEVTPKRVFRAGTAAIFSVGA